MDTRLRELFIRIAKTAGLRRATGCPGLRIKVNKRHTLRIAVRELHSFAVLVQSFDRGRVVGFDHPVSARRGEQAAEEAHDEKAEKEKDAECDFGLHVTFA